MTSYCNGCKLPFEGTRELLNHRSSFRCGGRFLPREEREILDAKHLEAKSATLDIRRREALAQAENARIGKNQSLGRRIRAQKELARRVLLNRRARP